MKIVICSSIDFAKEIKDASDILLSQGHKTEIPCTAKKILSGKMSIKEFLDIKEREGDVIFRRKAEEDLIRRYYRLIKEADAILVVNIDKKGIKNYIGGNVLMEMGFAYVLDKNIFLLNKIPQISYSDEIRAMRPVILNGDFGKIK